MPRDAKNISNWLFIFFKNHSSVVFALFSKVPKFLGIFFIYLNDYEINTLITYTYVLVYYKRIHTW